MSLNARGARAWNPSVAASAPGSDQTHGVQSNNTIALAPMASNRAFMLTRTSLVNGAATTNASATNITNSTAGGQNDAATAPSNAIVSAGCTRGRQPSRSSRPSLLAMRTKTASRNGATAKHTSGPISPRQIALRTIGFAA